MISVDIIVTSLMHYCCLKPTHCEFWAAVFREFAMILGAVSEKNRGDFATFLAVFHTFRGRVFSAKFGGFWRIWPD